MQPTPHIWMNGRLVDWQDARVHVLSHALHYGTSVFDSLRVYAAADGPAIFRLRDHMDRLFISARLYDIPLPYSVEDLQAGAVAVVADTGLDRCYVRIVAFRGYGRIGVSATGAPVDVAIAAFDLGPYLGDEAMKVGISATVSSWRRIDEASLLPAAKAAGHYLNSGLARLEAETRGCDEAILLAPDGGVCEGSGENIFLVRGRQIYTPPLTTGALAGITRDTVLRLAADQAQPVLERSISRADLYTADELFLTGTAAEITPVCRIDGRQVGDGAPGPLTRRLQAAFDDASHGRAPEYAHWLTTVGRPQAAAA